LLGEQTSGHRWLVREAPHRMSSRPTSRNMPTDCGRKFGQSGPFRVNLSRNYVTSPIRLQVTGKQKTRQVGGTWLAFLGDRWPWGDQSNAICRGLWGAERCWGQRCQALANYEGGAHRQLMLRSTSKNMPLKYGMKTCHIRQFQGRLRHYEQNSNCYETPSLPQKKEGGECPPPFWGLVVLGRPLSAFGIQALVRGDEESKPETIEGGQNVPTICR